MKSERSLQRAAVGRLNQAIRLTNKLGVDLHKQHTDFRPDRQSVIRETVSVLQQCVHEFNAYYNALETE